MTPKVLLCWSQPYSKSSCSESSAENCYRKVKHVFTKMQIVQWKQHFKKYVKTEMSKIIPRIGTVDS